MAPWPAVCTWISFATTASTCLRSVETTPFFKRKTVLGRRLYSILFAANHLRKQMRCRFTRTEQDKQTHHTGGKICCHKSWVYHWLQKKTKEKNSDSTWLGHTMSAAAEVCAHRAMRESTNVLWQSDKGAKCFSEKSWSNQHAMMQRRQRCVMFSNDKRECRSQPPLLEMARVL